MEKQSFKATNILLRVNNKLTYKISPQQMNFPALKRIVQLSFNTLILFLKKVNYMGIWLSIYF